MAEFRAGHAGDDHAVGDQRRDGHRVAVLRFGGLGAPELLAGLGIERDHVGVERGAEELAVEDRRAAIDDAATHDARGLGRILDRRLPDLLAGQGVEGDGLGVIRDVHHAVLDQRMRLLAVVVGHAVGPCRHQPLDVVAIDLRERAEALVAVAHAVGEDVTRRLFVVLQFVRGLGERQHRNCRAHERGQQRRSHHGVSSSSPGRPRSFVLSTAAPAPTDRRTIARACDDVDGKDASAGGWRPNARGICALGIQSFAICKMRKLWHRWRMFPVLRVALIAVTALAVSFAAGGATAADRIRIAVQKTGTLAWELDVIKTHGLDRKARSANRGGRARIDRGRQDRAQGRLGRSHALRLAVGGARALARRQRWCSIPRRARSAP